MIRNLRVLLPLEAGLKRQVLLPNLRSLNVVCGKNGSGKSTLLLAIQNTIGSRENNFICRDAGGDLARELAGKIVSALASAINHTFRGEPLNQKPASLTAEVEGALLPVLRATFGKDVPVMAGNGPPSGLGDAIHAQLSAELPFSTPEAWHTLVNQAWWPSFSADPIPCYLVPAKRAIAATGAVDFGAKPDPSGTALLQHLFAIRSAPFDSATHRLFRSAQRLFEELTAGIQFDVFLIGDNQISLRIKYRNSRAWIDSNETGLGYRDLVMLCYWLSRQDWKILLLEEPESHLHQDVLRRLAAHLSALDRQVFVATHARELIEANVDKTLLFTTYEEELVVREATSESAVLLEMGCPLSQLVSSGILILTEGHTDRFAIEVFLRKKGLQSTADIAFWPLGGDGMQHLDLTHLRTRFNIFVLLDQDPKSETARSRFQAHCDEVRIPVYRLERYAIENYFSPKAYASVFPNIADRVPSKLDSNRRVNEQIELDPKGHIRALAACTDLVELADTVLDRFLDRVISAVNQQSVRPDASAEAR